MHRDPHPGRWRRAAGSARMMASAIVTHGDDDPVMSGIGSYTVRELLAGRGAGRPDAYLPRSPIGLPSASASTHTRASGATCCGALRSVAPAASRVARAASMSSTSA